MVATCKFRGPSLPCVAFGFASFFFLAIFFPTVLIWGNWRVVRTNHWPHNDVGFVWGVSILVSILKLWDVSLWFWLQVRVPFPDHRFSVLFAVNIYCISCPGPRSSIAASNLAFTPLQQGDSRWTCLRGWDFPATYEWCQIFHATFLIANEDIEQDIEYCHGWIQNTSKQISTGFFLKMMFVKRFDLQRSSCWWFLGNPKATICTRGSLW